jgi:hypothetical protein
MSCWKTYWTGAALATGLLAALPASAQTVCTDYISTLPVIVTSSGTYCLTQSINSNVETGAAVTVSAGSSVVIDLRGFTINNLLAGTDNTAVGIAASNKQGIIVRNGRLTFFHDGIALTGTTGSRGHLVENVEVQFVENNGIRVAGTGIRVRNCTVRRVGSATSNGRGISVDGEGNVIEGNLVSDFVSQFGQGIEASGLNHLIVGNRVTALKHIGLYLINSPTTKYRDNLVNGTLYPYQGGIDAGGNY